MAQELKDLHLADLHERASELGVPRYRMLTRDQLIEAIEQKGEEEKVPAKRRPRKKSEPKKAETKKADRKKPDRKKADAKKPDVDEAETEKVTGVLDRMPQGYGFLRLDGLEPTDGDVYVSASQIRRCELRPGDEVSGPARAPRRGERHRALVRIASVNGEEPEGDRTQFEDLTPKAPHREIAELAKLEIPEPLAFGHRALVLGAESLPASELLRQIVSGLAGADARVTVILAGPSAAEAEEWEKVAPEAEIVGDGEMEPRDRVRAAELSLGRTKRRVEKGDDVIVLIDSLSSLAEGYRDVSRVKRLFGSGRELAEEDSGSLTVIAAVIADDEHAEDVRSALEGTEDILVELD